MTMRTYDVTVTREDRWWMISVPGLDRYQGRDGSVNLSTVTQARRLPHVHPKL